MKGQELKILFIDDMAFLTKEVALDFTQVCVYDKPVKLKAPAFWKIRVINYIEDKNWLYVEVLSYQLGETEFDTNQIQYADILSTIEKVTFNSIDTFGLFKTFKIILSTKVNPYIEESPIQYETLIVKEPIIEIYNEAFSIPIKNVTFLSGKVCFEKKISRFKEPIEFQILNENIIEEYDAIKNYFEKVLNTKKIQVAPAITITNGEPTSVNATSFEIEKIDKTLIEEVKIEFAKGVRKKELSVENQLFTMNEYFETFADEKQKTQQIFKDENDFFDNLVEHSESKHYRHLRFLSSKHQCDVQKLRFVHKPFSFVFLLKGFDNFYIVWETLDTQEATYIWTVSNNTKDLKQVLIDTDKKINLIIRDGKSEYRSRNEKNFIRVLHDYSDLQNGFNNWKEEIEKLIFIPNESSS